jgi:hypothetical protein
MSEDRVLKSSVEPAFAHDGGAHTAEYSASILAARSASKKRKYDRMFHYAWLLTNALLIISIVFAVFAAGWEFSTRRYLKGFSDAIIPATASPDEKIEAILRWMDHGPARLPYGPSSLVPDRDPTDTLNYQALLQVCGTATNAFINLANTGQLDVRRLLLLDQNHLTKHVVAEVLVSGRWIIVDPAYRAIMRDAGGNTVTREDLLNPATFSAVIKNIPNFPPAYTFDNTVHIRIARFQILGIPLRGIFNRLTPGWEDSVTMTLLVERESFAAMISAILLVVFFVVLRYWLRWFGKARLGIRAARLRVKIYRAGVAFLDSVN